MKMRQEFIPETEHKKAKLAAPWACKLAAVDEGHIAFESGTDYNKWRRSTSGWGAHSKKRGSK